MVIMLFYNVNPLFCHTFNGPAVKFIERRRLAPDSKTIDISPVVEAFIFNLLVFPHSVISIFQYFLISRISASSSGGVSRDDSQ